MSKNIIAARYTSVWDDCISVTTTCKINLNTHEIFDIERIDTDGMDLNALTNEYVTIDGKDHPACQSEELEFYQTEKPGTTYYWYN